LQIKWDYKKEQATENVITKQLVSKHLPTGIICTQQQGKCWNDSYVVDAEVTQEGQEMTAGEAQQKFTRWRENQRGVVA
jgi:hypothetical protein